MDIERGIRVAVDTGDVTLGSEKSIQSLKLGKGRLAVVAANSPKEILEDVANKIKEENVSYKEEIEAKVKTFYLRRKKIK